MNTPVVILTDHKEWYVFCELCSANNTTPDKVYLDYTKEINKQAQPKPQPQSFPIPQQQQPKAEQVFSSPAEDMNTLDELGEYLQDLNKERAKVEKQSPVDENHLKQLKAEIKIVTKRMLEMS